MTNTPEQTQPSRLDRIEAILEGVVQQQANTQQQLDLLTHNQANTQQRLDLLTDKVDHLTDKVDNLTDEVHLLTDYFTQVITNAESDRAAFQAESRRIWEYLLQQNQNGHNRDTDV